MKTVAFAISARKAFRKLPADVQAQISDKLARYAQTGAGDVVAMKGQDTARMRVGDFRVIFKETPTEICVQDVGHRRAIYR